MKLSISQKLITVSVLGAAAPRWPLKVPHLWPVKLLHPDHRKLIC